MNDSSISCSKYYILVITDLKLFRVNDANLWNACCFNAKMFSLVMTENQKKQIDELLNEFQPDSLLEAEQDLDVDEGVKEVYKATQVLKKSESQPASFKKINQ